MKRVILENVSMTYPVGGFRVRPRGTRLQTVGSAMQKDGRLTSIAALRNISIEGNTGDRIAIVGANGSGKTTFLKLLAGIYEPTEGRIEVTGRRMAIFNLGLGSNLEATGYRNIVIRGLMAGLSHKEIEEKIPEIAEFSGLGPYLDMPVRTYSQGMAMRLYFATLTAFEPDILILDEWLGAGDDTFRAMAAERMRSFVAKAGNLWFASHNRAILTEICDKALWLDGGVMRRFGEAKDVLDEYYSDQAERLKKSRT